MLGILIFASIHVSAQESTNIFSSWKSPFADSSQYLTSGIAFALDYNRDKAQSPRLLDGFLLMTIQGSRRYTPTLYTAVQGRFGLGILGKDAINQPQNLTVVSLGFGADVCVGVPLHLTPDSSFRAFVGPLISGFGNIRLNSALANSQLSYDIYAGLGGFGRVEYDMKVFGRTYTAYSQLNLPLLGIASRPYFSAPFQHFLAKANSENIDINEFRLVGIHTFPFVQWDTGVHYVLDNGNMITLGYTWQFYQYDYLNPVQAARHTFFISCDFKL